MTKDQLFSDEQAGAARRVRAIVEAKENMAWPCLMAPLKTLFGVNQLSPQSTEKITSLLRAQGVITFPNPLPNRAEFSALLFIEDSPFANGWRDQ